MTDDWRTPDTQALIEALLRLEDADEAGPLPARPVHAGRAARPGAALGRGAAARLGHALRRDLAAHRGEHRDDHADRVLAAPRRGRLPAACWTASARRRPDARAPPARRPQQGPARRSDAVPAPRRRPGVRGARPQPRVASPEPPAGHPVRAHGRRHRVRRRRRRRPRRDRRRPPGRDRRRAPRRALARLRAMPPGGRGADRLPDPGDRRPRRQPRRDVPPQRRPAVLRRPVHRRGHRPALGRRRGRARGSASPTRSSTSCRRARPSR